MRGFLMNMLKPLEPVDTSHLYNAEIRLKLRRYQYGSSYVGGLPTYFFAIVSQERPYLELGRCDLRVGESEPIRYAGHIGYNIYERYRGHHYALKASKLLLQFAHELGLEEVIITCDPDNIPSKKTLERLNGRYLAMVEVPKDSPCYAAGDRQKCQFLYKTASYLSVTG